MAKRKIASVDWYGDEFAAAMRIEVGRQLEQAGEVVARNTRGLLNERKGPRPSPVGQPPARQTGMLARSIGVGRVTGGSKATKSSSARVLVGSGVARQPLKYAIIHELGLGIHPKRRFLKPGFEKSREQIRNLLEVSKMVARAMASISPHHGASK